jgi:hypothetical protein
MRKIAILAAALAVAATFVPVGSAADPVPYPSPKVQQVFIAAQTVTTGGSVTNFYAPGSTVVFRAYAVDPKTKKVVAAKDVKYFYVTIPNQPNVKLHFDPVAPGASKGLPWTGTWTVPASFAEGAVPFRVLVQLSKDLGKRKGQFVQFPVSAAALTVSKNVSTALSPSGPNAGAAGTLKPSLDVALYVDTVAGTRPVGTAPRQSGCTQTNVFKRGEQIVPRVWGSDLATTDVLSTDNVKEAHISLAGLKDMPMSWGPHGAVGNQVFFWNAPFILPADYPFGEATIHVVFTLENGKVGTYDYVINVIP